MNWEQTIAEDYNISSKRVLTIWAIGQGILKNMRPKNESARAYLTDAGVLTADGKKLYDAAERARRVEITTFLSRAVEEIK